MQPNEVVNPSVPPAPEGSPPAVTPKNDPPEQAGQYDFILKDKPKPKKSLLPHITDLSQPVRLAAGGIIAFIILALLFVLIIGNHTSGSDKLVAVVAQGQEIIRIDTEATQQAKNSSSATQNLISTSSAVLYSQQIEMTQYLKNNNIKVSKAGLNANLNKNTDAQLQSASQNSNFDSFYLSYLKKQLNSYQLALQTAHKSAGKSGKEILSKDFNSIQTLLKDPQLVGVPN
jgi:hypothetical protein